MEVGIRIIETDKGYLTQIKKPVFLGLKRWVTLIRYYGTQDDFYFKTYKSAMSNLLNHIEEEIKGNSK